MKNSIIYYHAYTYTEPKDVHHSAFGYARPSEGTVLALILVVGFFLTFIDHPQWVWSHILDQFTSYKMIDKIFLTFQLLTHCGQVTSLRIKTWVSIGTGDDLLPNEPSHYLNQYCFNEIRIKTEKLSVQNKMQLKMPLQKVIYLVLA